VEGRAPEIHMSILYVIIPIIFVLQGIVLRKQNSKHWKVFLIGGLVAMVGVIASLIVSRANE
jgi:hypothetical protein